MRGTLEFMAQTGSFWALVRTLSEKLGYTNRAEKGAVRGSGSVKLHSARDQARALQALGLNPELVLVDGQPTELGLRLERYFAYRAEVLNTFVRPRLMDAPEAKALFT